ncbi:MULTISPECIES: hexaprenyl pyrophosphate synthase [Metallosphaera]|nr:MULTISPECIES: hexaprenyl pyrophosphate synthase [Metallosphaera]AKV73797.1 geranylgeranyl pyrophosphate synthase [Metallosphaera sedula]AKV76037.1 geranylgeranyl pyrophosphate synthase [Metallosphaera sedula]AKV78288.1 geranylgeranyl pyrophosphate synthase [Metallosphaera sedula]AKV80533.1 geranylgeranyl pyrophosphate synthase [Metallosphaera sedula]AKV82781.1 geranylgeranyl pyrophosphate synthase [Metallosphaera sedula]
MDLMEFWFRSRAVIDELVEKFLDESKEWETMEMSKYIMRDGKRFRGTLMFLFNGALGGEEKDAYPGALATEILHSASLALDDIVDYDEIRRGMKAAWAVYTNRKVIFVSNYLIPTALSIISGYGDKALRISVDLWKDTAVGALKDMYGKDEDYVRTIELKTASLFKLPTMLSSFSSGRSEFLDTLMEAGKDLGIIYQLIDDYVDCVTQDKDKLVGSARQLFSLTSGKFESFVRMKYREYKEHYETLLRSLPVKHDYLDQLVALPDFLAFGLMGEAGIKNKIF